MISNPPFNFVDNYIRPLAQTRVGQFIYKLSTSEIVKVVATAIFLEIISKRFLNGPLNESFTVRQAVVWAPVAEEIFFRFALLKGIRFFQNICLAKPVPGNGAIDRGKILNRQIFRVQLTALLFGLVHVDPKYSVREAVHHVVLAGLGGEVLGNVTEKYNSIVPAILLHALHNGMFCAALIYSSPLFIVIAIVSEIVFSVLCNPLKPSIVPALLSQVLDRAILICIKKVSSLPFPLLLGAMVANRLFFNFFICRPTKTSLSVPGLPNSQTANA